MSIHNIESNIINFFPDALYSDVLNYSGCLENERLKKLMKRCTRTMKKSLIIEPDRQCRSVTTREDFSQKVD